MIYSRLQNRPFYMDVNGKTGNFSHYLRFHKKLTNDLLQNSATSFSIFCLQDNTKTTTSYNNTFLFVTQFIRALCHDKLTYCKRAKYSLIFLIIFLLFVTRILPFTSRSLSKTATPSAPLRLNANFK